MFLSKIARFVVVFVATISVVLGTNSVQAKVDCPTVLGMTKPEIGFLVVGECRGTLLLMNTGQSVEFNKDGNYVFSLLYKGLLHGDPILSNDEYTWITPEGLWLKRSGIDMFPFAYVLNIYDTYVLLFIPVDSGFTYENLPIDANPSTSYVRDMGSVREVGVLTLSYYEQQVCKISPSGGVQNLLTSITPDWVELDNDANHGLGALMYVQTSVSQVKYGYLVMTNTSKVSRFESSAVFFRTDTSLTCLKYRR